MNRSKTPGSTPGVFFSCVVVCLVLNGCAWKSGKQQRHEITSVYSTSSPQFQRSAGSLLGPDFVSGNGIKTLVNGDKIFPAMIAAIRSAKHSVNFETYVFEDGAVAKQFTAALAERARAGVKVNAILDAQGCSHMGRANLATLEDAGVQIARYHSIYWLDPRRYNNRTHRKLLIIDGKIAFIGGVGIADEWSGDADSPQHWRDNHYEVTGPVVAQLQSCFVSNWMKTRGTMLDGADYFPPLPPAGPYRAQAIRSTAKNPNLDLMYLLSIASARSTIVIENAYFLPDETIRKELIAAARRGVHIEILVPGKYIDQKLVRLASQRHWPEMLRAGIKIYEYQPTMVHVKLMIIDGIFVSIGSGNLDSRSLNLNDEANLDVFDRQFAAAQLRLFEMDKRKSQEATLDKEGRLSVAPLMQQAAGVASPQL